MTFAFSLLDIVDLFILVGVSELIDALVLDRGCIVEVVDEQIVNLRPRSALTDTDVERVSKIPSEILQCQGDLDCV